MFATLFFIFHSCGSFLLQNKSRADQAAKRFHEELNSEQFDKIIAEADPKSPHSSDLSRLLHWVHTNLGDAGTGKLLNIRTDVEAAVGRLLTADYQTKFTAGSAIETFSWREHGNTLLLYKYTVHPNLPPPEP